MIILTTLAVQICFAREPMVERLLGIGERFDLFIMWRYEVTEATDEAPGVCASDANDALTLSLACSDLTYEIHQDMYVVLQKALVPACAECCPYIRLPAADWK